MQQPSFSATARSLVVMMIAQDEAHDGVWITKDGPGQTASPGVFFLSVTIKLSIE
jgi:hypothetical protein